MTTVATLLKAVKYDIRNYGEIDYHEDTVVHYLNRAVNILDARLIGFNSDQTLTQTYATLAIGYNYVSVPTRCLAVREVWIGQNRLSNRDQQELYYRRRFKQSLLDSGDTIAVGDLLKTLNRTTTDLTTLGAADNNANTYWVATVAGTLGTGDLVRKFQGQRPNFWSHVQAQIQFEAATGTAYTVIVIYDQGSADLTAASDMPFSGTYDDVIREVLIQMLIHKKKKSDSQTDAVYAQLFDQVLTMDLTNRKFWRKNYRLDF